MHDTDNTYYVSRIICCRWNRLNIRPELQKRPFSVNYGARCAMGKVGETKTPKTGNFNKLS